MVTDIADTTDATLPRGARLPINRCNLPAAILGGLTYQQHPAPLELDGVSHLHRDLLQRLDAIDGEQERASQFIDYMAVHFRLEHLDEAGLDPDNPRHRGKADYLRLLRGWFFNPDGMEAAVFKGWVESRFGLITRYHNGPIPSPDDDHYRAYLEQRAEGLYNTNALEAQLDLLYTYCQYELARRHPGQEQITLYRGINALDSHEKVAGRDDLLLLNNLNSFTSNPYRADEFGDRVIRVEAPTTKVVYYSGLLPGRMRGEEEYMVLGGVYRYEAYSYL